MRIKLFSSWTKRKKSLPLFPAFECSLDTWNCSSSFVHMRQGAGGGEVYTQRVAAEGGTVEILDDGKAARPMSTSRLGQVNHRWLSFLFFAAKCIIIDMTLLLDCKLTEGRTATYLLLSFHGEPNIMPLTQ